MTTRRWVVLAAALAAAALTARLGFWQLDRAAQKTALQARLDLRRAEPPLPAAALAQDAASAAAQEGRSITLTGRWLPAQTVYLDNRQMDAHPGFYVVTPLALPDGSAVVVQRGWLPRDPNDRQRVQAPPLPGGEVAVAGRIDHPPSRLFDFGGSDAGTIRQNLDLDAYSREMKRPLRPLAIVQQDGPSTPPDGLRRDWPAPAVDVQRHYGYAVQWFAMAVLILGLYVRFQLFGRRRHAS